MKRKIDIENLLTGYNLGPGDRIKRHVLNYYNEVMDRREMRRKVSGFWRITVPLYAVVFAILIAAVFSFYAGFSFMQRDKQVKQFIESGYERSEESTYEVSWYIAKTDLL